VVAFARPEPGANSVVTTKLMKHSPSLVSRNETNPGSRLPPKSHAQDHLGRRIVLSTPKPLERSTSAGPSQSESRVRSTNSDWPSGRRRGKGWSRRRSVCDQSIPRARGRRFHQVDSESILADLQDAPGRNRRFLQTKEQAQRYFSTTSTCSFRGVSALVENFRQPYAHTTVTCSEEYAGS
jgi:hypothetical protein